MKRIIAVTTVLVLSVLVVGLWAGALPRQATAQLNQIHRVYLSLVQRGSPTVPGINEAISQPYLQLVPTAAGRGESVTAYGSGFCGAPTCSPVTVTIGDRVVASDVRVSADGTFRATFTVDEYPGVYPVTASQEAADGSILSDAPPLIVTVSDVQPEAEPTIEVPSSHPANSHPTPVAPAALSEVQSLDAMNSLAEFQPNIKWGGRTVAVDVSPANTAIAIAASESGGLFRTTDSGATWAHIDTLLPFRMSDVKFAPGDASIVIATAWGDSRPTNGGGIWRSTDGGATWQKPATANPPAGPNCSARFNAWGIAFAPRTNDVFAGTDCGIAVSHDLGATWTHVVPNITGTNRAVYAVVAQPPSGGATGSIVDICAFDGHHRSTDGGTMWTAAGAGLPGCRGAFAHTITVSPVEPNVLFAATTGVVLPGGTCGPNPVTSNQVYESDDGGANWTTVISGACPSRPPWVAAHLSQDGDPSHVDVYFGSGLSVFRQTCTNTGGPGQRCSTTWNSVTVDHADQNGLAFSTSGNCAQYIVSDGGVHRTADCGANWTMTGTGTAGYNALQLYEVEGQVHPAHTDVYIGTQDNDIWASGDNGVTWPGTACCEGFFFQVPHSSPSDAGQTVTGVYCAGCSNFQSGAHFSGIGAWPEPPVPPTSPPTPATAKTGNPFLIEPGAYIEFGQPSPPNSALYLTTNTGSAWNLVAGATITRTLSGRPHISGPPASPTIYQGIRKPGGALGIVKITGARTSSATVQSADAGLNNVGGYCMGQGTFVCPQVFGVDPNDPQHLIAADIGTSQMKVSRDGGATWTVDAQLTNLVTRNGQLLFREPNFGTQAHVIAFDPTNGNRIFVGTETAGIIVSTDGGSNWAVVPGSEKVTPVTAFFFDEVQKTVLISTYGRGLWKMALPPAPTISVTKLLTPPAEPPQLGTELTFDIVVHNTGTVTVTTLPADDWFDARYLEFVSASITPNAVLPGRLEWDNLTGLANGFGTELAPGGTFTLTTTLRVIGCPPDGTTTNKIEINNAVDANGDPILRISDTASVDIACPAVSVTKTMAPLPCWVAGVGDTVTFSITVTNTGNTTITVLPLEDTYDTTYLSYLGATPNSDDNVDDGTINWSDLTQVGPNGFGTDLAPGAGFTVSVDFQAKASTQLLHPPETVDTATVPGATDIAGVTAATASGRGAVEIADADLFVTKAGPAEIMPGSEVTYTITFGNNGPDDATHVRLQDMLPAGATYVSDTLGGATFPVPGQVEWFVGTVLAGSSHAFELTVQIDAGTLPGTMLTDDVWIESGHTVAGDVCGVPDSDLTNNHGSVTSTVLADFGDAPDPPYATRLASGGAYHGDFTREWLGVSVDGETDAKFPDNFDDGVGIEPVKPLERDKVQFWVNTSGLGAARYGPAARLYVRGWIDFNQDGVWTDPDERIVDWSGGPGMWGTDHSFWPLSSPDRRFLMHFNVPWAPAGSTWARFRLSYGAPVGPTGPAPFGEVEDYQVMVGTVDP